MMLLRLVLVLLIATLPSCWEHAQAGERPPRYDSNALCVRLATTIDGLSPELLSQCLINQGDAHDSVRRIWSTTAEYIQDDCAHRARADGDGDYIILKNCIRAQNRQALPETLPTSRKRPLPQ